MLAMLHIVREGKYVLRKLKSESEVSVSNKDSHVKTLGKVM